MSKPASRSLMAGLHRKIAEYIDGVLDEALAKPDPDDPDSFAGMPLDAATMGFIGKFLKDNEITCDPADKGDISALREKFSRANQARAVKSVHGILEDAQSEGEYLQ